MVRAFNASALAATVLALVLAVMERMQFVHDSIWPFLQKAQNPGLYSLSHGISHSVVPNASPVFGWLSNWQVDLATPWFTVPAYFLTTALAGYLTWCLLRDVAKVDNRAERLAILFALGFAEAKFVEFAHAGWITQHNFTFTMIAGALRVGFLYGLLTGRFRMAVALLIGINLLTFKVGWPLLGFLVLVVLVERRRDPLVWLGLAVSMISPLMSAIQTQVPLAPGEALAVFQDLRGQHGAEDNPFANVLPAIGLFFVAMGMGWVLAGQMLDKLGAQRVRIIILATLGVFVAGGSYIQFNGFGFPVAAAVLLSPARAVEAAALLVYLLMLVWVVRHPSLLNVEKAALFAALLVLKVQPGGKLMVAALGLAAAVALGWVIRHRLGVVQRIMGLGNAIPLALLLALPCLAVAGTLYASPTGGLRVRHDPELGLVPAATPRDALPMLRAIRSEPGDRLIVFDRGDNDANLGTNWNYMARKSGLYYDLYYLRRSADIAEQKRRDAIARSVLGGLASGAVSPAGAQGLRELGATVVVRREKLVALSGWKTVNDYGAWIEVRP